MSSDNPRIDTQQLIDAAEAVHVDTLDKWEGDPYIPDIGIKTIQSTMFGQIGLVLTHGTTIIYGSDVVDAQRHQPDDDGLVPVVDLAKAGFSRQKAESAALALWTNHRRATTDDVLLAELVTTLAADDELLLQAAGWDGDDIDALLAHIDESNTNPLDSDPALDSDDEPVESNLLVCPNCQTRIPA